MPCEPINGTWELGPDCARAHKKLIYAQLSKKEKKKELSTWGLEPQTSFLLYITDCQSAPPLHGHAVRGVSEGGMAYLHI